MLPIDWFLLSWKDNINAHENGEVIQEPSESEV